VSVMAASRSTGGGAIEDVVRASDGVWEVFHAPHMAGRVIHFAPCKTQHSCVACHVDHQRHQTQPLIRGATHPIATPSTGASHCHYGHVT